MSPTTETSLHATEVSADRPRRDHDHANRTSDRCPAAPAAAATPTDLRVVGR